MTSLSELVRARRTTKVFGAEPLDRATIAELLELARWAPNHHLTNPWRFSVLGPNALARLKDAAGTHAADGSGSADAAAKLDRAPTLIAVGATQSGSDDVQDEEDLLAAGCAAFLVLLGAEERGLASYWRTPAVLRTAAGRAALGVPDDVRLIGLLHLGPRRQEQPAPERAPLADVVTWLD
jgi:nitroreductase